MTSDADHTKLSPADLKLELPYAEPDPQLVRQHEQRDIHEIDAVLQRVLASEHQHLMVSAQPRHVTTIKGMGGKVYDFRNTGLCPPSGGHIDPLIFVHHIPVIRNVTGTADLLTLGNVLHAQRLAVHNGTDSEGNVALFTPMNRLCWHARGANLISIGCEHMHLAIGEPWTEVQMRAAAYVSWRAYHYYGIPLQSAALGAGNGFVTVKRRGHTTHRIEADKAGFKDRSDPGPGFHRGHVYELARFYDQHHRF